MKDNTPQLENGYLKIANEIIEHLALIRIPGEARQVLDVILRQTYGFNKKVDTISLSQFEVKTGLKKPNIVRAIKRLDQMRVIIKIDNAKGVSYSFNKDWRKWEPLSKLITDKKPLSKLIKNVIKIDKKPLSKLIPTKDIIKDITKDNARQKKSTGGGKQKLSFNPIKIYIDLYRETNHRDCALSQAHIGCISNIARTLIKTEYEFRQVVTAFLKDSDPFLRRNGHDPKLLTGRINAYLKREIPQKDKPNPRFEDDEDVPVFEDLYRNWEVADLFDTILEYVSERIRCEEYESWFACLRSVGNKIVCPGELHRTWLNSNYRELVEEAVKAAKERVKSEIPF